MNADRTEKLDLRLTLRAEAMLLEAARASKRSMSDFVLESALARADEVLADRRHLDLDADAWTRFSTALDAEPRPLPRMRRLLTEPGLFDALPLTE